MTEELIREKGTDVDLNKKDFPPGRYDRASFLGVLEYVHDIGWPLNRVTASASNLLVSEQQVISLCGPQSCKSNGIGGANCLNHHLGAWAVEILLPGLFIEYGAIDSNARSHESPTFIFVDQLSIWPMGHLMYHI